MKFFYIGLFGVLGVYLRYLMALSIRPLNKDFLATIIVNIIGCFIIGYCYKSLSNNENSLLQAISIGFCGGLTTYSSFSLDIFKFIENDDFVKLTMYFSITVGVSLLALVIGHKLAQ